MGANNILTPIPMIASNRPMLERVEQALNQLGADGYALKTVATGGMNHRYASAGMVATITRWEYHVIQFNFKLPKFATEQLEALGADGWELVTIYSQGGGRLITTAAVLKRPAGDLLDDVAEETEGPEEIETTTPVIAKETKRGGSSRLKAEQVLMPQANVEETANVKETAKTE